MQKFLGLLVGGGKKAVRELPKAAPASAPVLSGLAKQRQLEEAAIAKRGAEVGDRAQNPKTYLSSIHDLHGAIKAERVPTNAQGVQVVRDHREAWARSSRGLPGMPSREDLPSHRLAAGLADGARGAPPGLCTGDDWQRMFLQRRADPATHSAARLAEEYGLPAEAVEQVLAHHNSVLVLGNTRGQQAGAWGPPAGLVTQESMETSGMTSGWFLVDQRLDGGGAGSAEQQALEGRVAASARRDAEAPGEQGGGADGVTVAYAARAAADRDELSEAVGAGVAQQKQVWRQEQRRQAAREKESAGAADRLTVPDSVADWMPERTQPSVAAAVGSPGAQACGGGAEVEVEISDIGPMGLSLAVDADGEGQPVLDAVVPGGLLAAVEGGRLSRGMVLVSVDGEATTSHSQGVALLHAAGRPVRLQFSHRAP
jgi:hypothetical protein